MATRFLTDADRAALDGWPPEIDHGDLAAHFTLSIDDVRWIRQRRQPGTRLAIGVSIGALSWLGHLPDPTRAPASVVGRVAATVGVDTGAIADYATVGVRVRQADAAAVIAHAGWRLCGRGEWKALGDSLTARAMEHDDPSVLFGLARDHLRSERIVRPGLDRLQRAVATARRRATAEVYLRCRPFLTDTLTAAIDGLCEQDSGLGVAPIVWISSGATSAAPEAIKTEIAKLTRLHAVQLPAALGGVIPSERQRHLARIARRSSPAALRRLEPIERYPTLIAWALVATSQVIDEIVQQYDRALAGTDHRVRHLVAEQRSQLAAADLERLELLDEILNVVLDDTIDDVTLGHRIRALDHDRLTNAARPLEQRRRRDGGVLALLEARYSHIRSFAPHVLATLDFDASVADSELLDAVQLLQQLNRDGLRRIPVAAPAGFIPTRWRGYLDEATAASDDTRHRHFWELATLYQLRDALRSGEIWVHGSRRYRDPASYLISPVVWPSVRDEFAALSDQPATYAERLDTLDVDLDHHLDRVDELLANGDGLIALDADGQLRMSPLPAEAVDPGLVAQRDLLAARLPRVPITDLLIEIDAHTRFSDHLTHAAGSTPRIDPLEHRRNLYAAILAQACNLGIERMADLTGISADTLTWTTRWYLRDDTVRAANTAIVDAHHHQPLATVWGGGTLSSSDGMRLPMRGQSLTARRLSRYFVDEGVTQYTHVSDQHTTYGTQVIVTTDRDATYTLDGILGNTTELPIAEHTTDTHGQTLLTFGLYDLVGLRLSPRIARLTDHRLWRPHPASHYQRWRRAGPLLAHPARTDLIAEHWDDLQRLGASLKTGHATASLLVARLQAGSRQHPLARALIEHGKLLRTVHTLRWYSDVEHRRRMQRQLNRGEALHDLRRFIAFAHSGEVRHRQHDDQTTQAHCHTLVVNGCVLWTTTYLQHVIDDGPALVDSVLAHTSPARYAHINPYGTYTIDIPAVLAQPRRPLRPAR